MAATRIEKCLRKPWKYVFYIFSQALSVFFLLKVRTAGGAVDHLSRTMRSYNNKQLNGSQTCMAEHTFE